MTSTLWGLGAAVVAVATEWLYRSTHQTFWSLLPVALPLQMLVGYGIYNLVRQPGGSLITGAVIFGFSTALLRIVVTLVAGHPVSAGAWIAFGLMFVARLVQRWVA